MIDFLDDFDIYQKLYTTYSEPPLEIFQDKEISKKILKRLILEWGTECERKAIEFTVRLFFITKQKYESPESVDKAFEKIYGLWKAQKGGKDE